MSAEATISDLRNVLSRLRKTEVRWEEVRWLSGNSGVARGTTDGFSVHVVAPSSPAQGSDVELQVVDSNTGGTAFEFIARGFCTRPLTPGQEARQIVYQEAVKEVWAYLQEAKREFDARVEAEERARMEAARRKFFA
jgi:hypothetical protein